MLLYNLKKINKMQVACLNFWLVYIAKIKEVPFILSGKGLDVYHVCEDGIANPSRGSLFGIMRLPQ